MMGEKVGMDEREIVDGRERNRQIEREGESEGGTESQRRCGRDTEGEREREGRRQCLWHTLCHTFPRAPPN
jgi:hypothetical protein